VTAEPEALHVLAECADGSLRDALSLLDQILCNSPTHITYGHIAYLLGLATKQHVFDLDQAFAQGHLPFAFELAACLYAEGKDLSHFLDKLIEHYQTILKYQLKATHSLCFSDTEHARYSAATQIYTKEQALYILDYLVQWSEKFQRLGCKLLHLELILLHVLRSKSRVSLDTLVFELKSLKEQQPPTLSIPIAEAAPAVEPQTAPAPVASKPITFEPIAVEPKESATQDQQLETLMRFASIELNGVLKK